MKHGGKQVSSVTKRDTAATNEVNAFSRDGNDEHLRRRTFGEWGLHHEAQIHQKWEDITRSRQPCMEVEPFCQIHEGREHKDDGHDYHKEYTDGTKQDRHKEGDGDWSNREKEGVQNEETFGETSKVERRGAANRAAEDKKRLG
ncbi:hypothetical protein cyc_00599 [Cyclospora cayetanensis]|uniref:Uncharacterized protein n=1 Tax=Cyclospora cayetanensis TaxID=88456 RepID=A0A1D3CYU4_9EIME|nr:hypothetical protein cyc_00599 [Cyclospora cayetanensis]